MDSSQIMNESKILYTAIRNSKTTTIVDTFNITHPLYLDLYVKKYMMKYGIDNVRGGSYTREIITPEERQFLQREFEEKPNCFYEIHEQIEYWSKLSYPELKKIREVYKYKACKYDEVIKKYTEMKYIKSLNKDISYIIMDEIKWLENIIYEDAMGETKPVMTKSEIKERETKYKNVLLLFQDIVKKIESMDFYIMNKEYDVYIRNPEFVFDNYILHTEKERDFSTAVNVCELFEGMLTAIFNRLDEYEFDLKMYKEEEKTNYDRIDYYIENLFLLPENNL